MRQAGFEAAKKAGDAKKANTAKMVAQAKGSEQSGVSSETLRKLDNSAPTGMPPPSGTTDASSAVAPETGNSTVTSKADAFPATTPISTQVRDSMQELHLGEANTSSSQPTGSAGHKAGSEESENRERKTAILEDPDAEAKVEGSESQIEMKGGNDRPTTEKAESGEGEAEADTKGDAEKTKDVTASSDEAPNLPGKKTQDQPAASAEDAGSSIAD